MPATFDAFQEIRFKLLKMQQRMETLEAENATLREELAALRLGRRVSVLIEGRKFALEECLPDGDAQNILHNSFLLDSPADAQPGQSASFLR